jgi:hypothetical protein
MEGEGGACHLRQASPGLPAIARPRSRRAPGVQPFTPEPFGPSGRDSLATGTITAQRLMRGGAGRIGTRSGLDAGGRLRTIRASRSRTQPLVGYDRAYRVARQPPGALAEQSGSERWPEEAAARPGRCRPGLKPYRKSSPTVARLQCPTATAGVRCRFPGTGSPLPLLTTQRFVRIGVIPESNRRARRLQRVTNIGDPVPPLISQCPRRTRGLLPPAHHHGWGSRISGFRTQGTV